MMMLHTYRRVAETIFCFYSRPLPAREARVLQFAANLPAGGIAEQGTITYTTAEERERKLDTIRMRHPHAHVAWKKIR